MPGALYTVNVDGIALAAATLKTVLEVGASATRRTKVIEWWIDFDGATSTAVPVKCTIGRYSAGVTTATSITPDPVDGGDGAYTGVVKHTTSTEGAGTLTAASGWAKRIHPQGSFHYQAPLGRELIIPKSGFLRMALTAAAIVNATVGMWLEE